MKRPRIGIYLEEPLGQGGPARYVRGILNGIDPQEFDMVMFCPPGGHTDGEFPFVRFVNLLAPAPRQESPSSDGPAAKIQKRGLAARAFGTLAPRTIRIWAGFARNAKALAKILASCPVDLLHTNQTGCEESPLAARWAGIPLVLGTFNIDSTYDLAGERSGFCHRTLEFVSNHCLHRAIGASEDTSRDWIRRTRLSESRVTTIHYGIDPARFQRRVDRATARAALGLSEHADLVVGAIGRLHPDKGHIYLIEAMARLAPDFPNAILVIAGTGPLRDSLMAKAAQLGVQERVRFLGFVTNVQMVLDALDIFAFPSLCETLGFALLEAMATEIPAVGSAVGGVPEVIVHGETGLLVPPRNSAALAGALQQLFSSPANREQMGRAGRQRVKECFLESTCVTKTIAVYRQMLGVAGPGISQHN